MAWKFQIREISNGAYACEGVRDTGNAVGLTCNKREIYRIYAMAYNIETEFGTLSSRAVYEVVSSSKAEYLENAFGSWSVLSPNKKSRYVYDGKDFILMVYSKEAAPVWQGQLKEKSDVYERVFQLLEYDAS